MVAFPSAWRGGGRCVGAERGRNGGSTPCMSLKSGALLLWQSGFPPQAFLVVDFLPPVLSGCLLTAYSTPPLRFAPQSPLSSSQPRVYRQTYVPVWGAQCCGMDCPSRSHFILSATDWPFRPPLTASDAPLLSQLISPLVRGLPQMREPLLCSTPR